MGRPVSDLIFTSGLLSSVLPVEAAVCRTGIGAGLESEQVREFKQLQDENTKLKRLVADLSLDKVMHQDVLSNKL